MRALVAILILIAATVSGCASQGARVRCDGKLEPINHPSRVQIREALEKSSVLGNGS